MTESIKGIKEQHKQQIDSAKTEIVSQLKDEMHTLEENVLLNVSLFLGEDQVDSILNDYLTNTGIVDIIKDKILGAALKRSLAGDQGSEAEWLILYNKIEKARESLLALDRSTTKKNFSEKLNEFRKEFQLDEDYYVPDEDCDGDDIVLDEDRLSLEEYDDRDPRDKALAAINEIKEIDAKTPISYKMWSRIINWSNPSVDCSGLMCDIMRRAGFTVGDQTSRSLFTKFDAKKLSSTPNWSVDTNNFNKTKPWDLIYWDTTNPAYDWKWTKIPTINVQWAKHRIHHVAMVTEKLSDGRLRIFESNGKSGVTERIVDPKNELTSKSKSELYVSHMRYDALPKKKEEIV